MIIKIKDFISGVTAASYNDGKKCLDVILKSIDTEKVTLDFDCVEYAIAAFLNPVINDLILAKGDNVMNKILIDNANRQIRDKINLIKNGTLIKREDLNII